MPRCPARRSALPRLEILEDRCVLSTTSAIDLNGLAVNNTYSKSDILVQFRTGTSEPAPIAVPGTSLGPSLTLVPGLYQVHITGSETVAQALAAYHNDPRVLNAQPDYLLTTSAIPNDPKFSQQYYLQNTGQQGGTAGADIHAAAAWNVTTGNSSIVVAVMDSGIDYNHPDLYQNIWINQAEIPASRMKNLVDVDHDGLITFADLNNPINWGPYKIEPGPNGIVTAEQILAPMVLNALGQDTGQGGWAYPGNTQDGDTAHPNDFIGWNFVTNTNNPYDDFSHGTAVAGIIGATGNNGTGIAGIDWQASLMAVKFISAQGSGTIGDFINGLDYAVAHGARISNNSWNGAANDPFLEQAISNAQSHGDIFVAAAGNNGTNNDTNPDYPSSFPLDNIVSVAATDNTDHLASFSNFGPHTVSIAAPGVDILSTFPQNNYGSLSGTSLSTPEVTGVLALVWGQHPDWTYKQVIQQVLSTADPLPSLAGKLVSGGRLDAAAAVGAARVQKAPKVVTSSPTGPAYNTLSDVILTFDQAMDPPSLSPSSVTLTGPSGQAIPISWITAEAGSGNTVFDVHFATQTAAGNYTLNVASAARDSSGNSLQPFQATFFIGATSTFSSSGSTTIPTGAGAIAVSSITVAQDISIADVAVGLNLSYPQDQDLYIHLQAPDGTDVVLAGRRGWGGGGFLGTTFDDHAAVPIMSGQVPFGGSYQPEVRLAALDGKNARGVWKLWVENLGGSGSGTLSTWSLTFTAASAAAPPPPPPPTPSPPPTPGGTQVVASSGTGPSYNTLSDVILTFNVAMNPATLTPADVTLSGPAGQSIAVLSVTPFADSGNTVFDVHFATQTAPGTYTLNVGSTARDASGNALQAFKGAFALTPTYTFASSSSVAIPAIAGGIAVSSITVDQDISIADVAASLSLNYPQDEDLYIHLQAPDGTDVVLAGRRGWFGDGFSGTTFDDHATVPIMSGQAPFGGSYQPDVRLAVLDGKDVRGVWKLWVENLGGSASGSLTSWSLAFTAAPPSVPQPTSLQRRANV
jgi:subtilisin family serine protease/subtilisin-like proprotein convertase family protein